MGVGALSHALRHLLPAGGKSLHFPVKAVFTTTFSGPSHSRHSCTKAGWFRHLAPQQLAAVRQPDLQWRVPLEHGHHQLDMLERRAVHAGDPQINGGVLLCRTAFSRRGGSPSFRG